jgi:replicative DNA helicase
VVEAPISLIACLVKKMDYKIFAEIDDDVFMTSNTPLVVKSFMSIKELVHNHSKICLDTFIIKLESFAISEIEIKYFKEKYEGADSESIDLYLSETLNDYTLRRLSSVYKDLGKAIAKSDVDTARKLASDIAVVSGVSGAKAKSLKEITEEVNNEKLKELEDGNKRIPKTLFLGFDKEIKLTKGNVTIIAGRPSMGKTTFALNCCVNMARQGFNVAIYLLETNAEETIETIYSNVTQIPAKDINAMEIIESIEFNNNAYKMMKLGKGNIFLCDNLFDITDIHNDLIRLKNMHGLSLFMIDYLQLMTYKEMNSFIKNKETRISELSRKIKLIAGELETHSITVSQLNRAVESRKIPIPMLSDLRDSGALEQDASNVVFIYRPEYYGISTYESATSSGGKKSISSKNLAVMIRAKVRKGIVGAFLLKFDAPVCTFRNAT